MSDPVFLRLDVTVLEDLHTGTGTGSEDIDALLARDRHGRPIIRGSHVKGLLREAGDELVKLSAMDRRDLGRLLGGQARGALQITSLRCTADARSVVWWSTARQPDSRVPLDDTLRSMEHVAAGTKFQATWRLQSPRDEDLVRRLVRRLDRLGGDRNRGSGLVEARLSRATEQKRLSVPARATSLRLRLVLKNLEPLCLPATRHPGNLVRSQSFIRGQALRGALMGWSIRRGLGGMLNGVLVGDALPLPQGVTRAAAVMPVPLSVLTEKPKGGNSEVPWWAQEGVGSERFDSLIAERDDRKEKPKRPGAHELLCRVSKDGPWQCFEPDIHVRLRNKTAAKDTQEDAQLFSLEEIAEDTFFQADLLFADKQAAAIFLKTYNAVLAGSEWLAVGRGGQPVMVAHPAEFVAEAAAGGVGDKWSLTLTSDLIARGPNLGFLVDLDAEALATLAGVEADGAWKIIAGVAETEAVHGFNASSGLPRVPALAIRRGSCWLIEGDGSAKLARALAAHAALGERTSEGYGRFVLDLHRTIGPIQHPENSAKAVLQNRGEELRVAAARVCKALRHPQPSRSQLQQLRALVLAATNEGQIKLALDEIEKAPEQRPRGALAWTNFPLAELRREGSRLPFMEQQLLISHVVECIVGQYREDAA